MRRTHAVLLGAALGWGGLGGNAWGCAAIPQRGPKASAPVLLLAAVPAATEPAATQPVITLDARQAARAAIELAGRLQKLQADAAYVNGIAQRMRNELVQSTAELVRQGDIEVQLRATQVMGFDAAISQFLARAAAIDDPQKRDAFMEWGLRPGNVHLVAQAFDADPAVRAQVAATLAGRRGEQIDRLLAALLQDDDAEVVGRTIDAIWDRPLSGPLIDAVWDLVVAEQLQRVGVNFAELDGIASAAARAPVQRAITIRGRAFVVGENPYTQSTRQQLAPLAADLLLHADAPGVRDRLDALFVALAPPRSDGRALARAFSPNYNGDAALELQRLVEQYAPPHALPCLIALIQNSSISDGYMNDINGKMYRMSSRIDVADLALALMHESPEDYGIVRLVNYNRSAVPGQQEDEEKALKKVVAFWKTHQTAAAPATHP
jgi:hypothetical protein